MTRDQARKAVTDKIGISGPFTDNLVDAMAAVGRIADGLVHRDRWCKSFEPMEGHNAQSVQTGGPQGQAAPGNGNPGGSENSSGQAGGSNPLAPRP